MNAKTIVLGAACLLLIGYVSWSAYLPDPYFSNLEDVDEPEYHQLGYVGMVLVYSLLLFALLRPWKRVYPFLGSLVAAVASIVLFVILFLAAMHAPPAHFAMISGLFFITPGLIFYSGYCTAHRRRPGNTY